MRTRSLIPALISLLIALAAVVPALAGPNDQTPPYPGDMSVAGILAAIANGEDPAIFETVLPEGSLGSIRDFVRETRAMGLTSRSGRITVFTPGPLNVNANTNHVGDAIGETQSEVAVAVYRDTVVVGWNDSRGFVAGNTLSSFAYSTDGGVTFVDGGNMPLDFATSQAFGDPGIDTDERGNWYYNQIYTRAAGAPGPTAEQDIGVHRGRFNGVGVMVWNVPVMASIGTAASGNLDKCLLAADRVTGNVYVAYTRFTATPQIEIVRSVTTGATWGAAWVLDADVAITSSKQGARPICGPAGEVYVVWEKFANYINCPDGAGNVTNTTGVIGFSRSLNFGATYDPQTVVGTVDHSWTWSGPGDLRERGNDFPDIAVDRSGGPYNGRIYVTWHESATWTSNLSAGAVRAEAADAANNNPGGAELFVIGENVTGSISSNGDFDYWTFSATQGQNLFFDLDPQGFNCGITGTSRGMRLRLWATQSPYPNPTGFPDTLLAASALGTFADRIVWTAPRTGSYLIRLQRSSGTVPFTYLLRVRNLTFGAPNAGRDARDVVVAMSSNQGGVWGPEQRVNDDAAGLENRRPFIAADGNGHVHVFWHDSRSPGLGTNAALTSVFGTTSRDGGATWTPNYCVTDQLSFFSFNTLAIPNLGDYNQAMASGDCVFPAWSDQRLSTGDVRTPGTNTFTAGLGPEAYTTKVQFQHSVTCPANEIDLGGSSATLTFRGNNTGTVPDRYNWYLTEQNGWYSGPTSGTTGPINPSSFFDIFVQLDLPLNCSPSTNDTLSWKVQPVGDPDGGQTCYTVVTCDRPVATLVSGFLAWRATDGVTLAWSSSAIGQVQAWNIYRGASPDGGFERLNDQPITMSLGGDFRFRDIRPADGTVYYRLSGIFSDGHERPVETIAFANGRVTRSLEFRLAGSNPFTGSTTIGYALPSRAPVRIDVYNVAGERVRTLVNTVQDAGAYSEPFSLRSGETPLGAGVYFVTLTFGNEKPRTLRVVALE